MTKEKNEKVTLRHCMRRKLFMTVFIQVMGVIVGDYFTIAIVADYFPEKEVLVRSLIPTNAIVLFVFLIINIYIVNKGKNDKYVVHTQHKICIKNKKRIRYSKITPTQSIMQKIFGLITLKFKNDSKWIVFKDVSVKEVEDYLGVSIRSR